VDRLNRSNDRGERLMRIHAVAFPVYFVMEPAKQHPNIIRFAALMRELTHRNGGTFVGLNDIRP
jgi:hypothetical protein